MEVWKPIEGFEHYAVSNHGNIKNLKTGRIRKPGNQSVGYQQVLLSDNCRTKIFYIHRLVCKAFHPNPENKKFVNHIDGNKTNNAAYNLEWVNGSENMRHAVRTGLRPGRDVSVKVIDPEGKERLFCTMKEVSFFMGFNHCWTSENFRRKGNSFKYRNFYFEKLAK